MLLFIIIFPIKTFCSNNFDTTASCYNCHQKFKDTYFSKNIIHPPTAEGNCEACHSPHGKSNQLVLKDSINNLCDSCHDFNDDKFLSAHKKYFLPSGSCIKCHNPHASSNDKLLPAYQHTPFKNRNCPECHQDRSDSTKLKFTITRICRSCHKEKSNPEEKKLQNDKKVQDTNTYHVPFLVGQCTACHDPHASNNPNQLKTSSGFMCIEECHTSIRKEQSSHQPVSSRECLRCHAPHLSPNNYLLKTKNNIKMSSVVELCQECHKNVMNGKNIHMVVLAGECDACHKNHNASYKKLLKNEGKNVCYVSACHSSVEKKRFVHTPIADGKCVSCHNPHSSPNKNLIRLKGDAIMIKTSQLCYQCHKPFESKKGIHKPVAQGECHLCHETHSAANGNLLKDKVRNLCLSCHEQIASKAKHNISDNKRCTEDCHDPHFPRQ
ncbi:hypothetical protein HZA55_07975 [Candidatus Poribacteria bacterium]|nr:hypothetical protein [Candidatus Poribacteria bacterium]